MIRPLLLSLCVTVGGWSLSGSAVADEDADHAALKELVTAYEQAIATGDPNSLKPHLADDFTGVMVTGEEVTNLNALDAYWQKIQGYLGKGGKYTVEVVVPQPAVIVGDLAYATGTTKDLAVTSDGKEYPFEGFWTAVCRRDGDQWKIVRIHGSMDALTNVFAITSLQRASTYSGVIGGIAGFFVGALLLWLVTRRRPTAAPIT
jgi:ketosteroid isomerase-like protein